MATATRLLPELQITLCTIPNPYLCFPSKPAIGSSELPVEAILISLPKGMNCSVVFLSQTVSFSTGNLTAMTLERQMSCRRFGTIRVQANVRKELASAKGWGKIFVLLDKSQQCQDKYVSQGEQYKEQSCQLEKKMAQVKSSLTQPNLSQEIQTELKSQIDLIEWQLDSLSLKQAVLDRWWSEEATRLSPSEEQGIRGRIANASVQIVRKEQQTLKPVIRPSNYSVRRISEETKSLLRARMKLQVIASLKTQKNSKTLKKNTEIKQIRQAIAELELQCDSCRQDSDIDGFEIASTQLLSKYEELQSMEEQYADELQCIDEQLKDKNLTAEEETSIRSSKALRAEESKRRRAECTALNKRAQDLRNARSQFAAAIKRPAKKESSPIATPGTSPPTSPVKKTALVVANNNKITREVLTPRSKKNYRLAKMYYTSEKAEEAAAPTTVAKESKKILNTSESLLKPRTNFLAKLLEGEVCKSKKVKKLTYLQQSDFCERLKMNNDSRVANHETKLKATSSTASSKGQQVSTRTLNQRLFHQAIDESTLMTKELAERWIPKRATRKLTSEEELSSNCRLYYYRQHHKKVKLNTLLSTYVYNVSPIFPKRTEEQRRKAALRLSGYA